MLDERVIKDRKREGDKNLLHVVGPLSGWS